jgi:hypothetical protein
LEIVFLVGATLAALGYSVASSPHFMRPYAMIAFTAIAMGMRNAAVRFGANFRLADLYRQVVRVKKMQRSTLCGMTTNERISTETGRLSRSDGAGIRLEYVKVLCKKYVKNTFILLLSTRWFS